MEEMSADDVKIEVYVHTSRSEHTIHIKKTELQQHVGLRCELIKVMFWRNQADEVSVTTVYQRRPGRTPEL